jgi:hypothetical protein
MDWRVELYYDLKSQGMSHGQTLEEFLRTRFSNKKDLQCKIEVHHTLKAAGMGHGKTLEEDLSEKDC